MYERSAALKIDKILNRNVVAHKTVIALGEYYITPGVAVISELQLISAAVQGRAISPNSQSSHHLPLPATRLQKVNWISNCRGAHSINT